MEGAFYKLYNLTYDEVKIIEPEFAIGREDYKKYLTKNKKCLFLNMAGKWRQEGIPDARWKILSFVTFLTFSPLSFAQPARRFHRLIQACRLLRKAGPNLNPFCMRLD